MSLVHSAQEGVIPTETEAGGNASDPWSDAPLPLPVVSPEIEAWARALVVADGEKPDKPFGYPALPRWCAYVRYAEQCIRARDIVAKGAA